MPNSIHDTESPQRLSLERKVRMHEAREAIIERLARDLPESIDIQRFLNVVVSEIGRMLEADRCDVLQLVSGKELEISHEWRRDSRIPSRDRKSTRLNSSHVKISYAVFCL